MPLAFHHCGDQNVLAQARQSAEVVLRVLQNLDEAHPEKEKEGFKFHEFVSHASEIYDEGVHEKELTFGLYLSQYFGVLSDYSGNSARPDIISSFSLTERIAMVDPVHVWDDYISEVTTAKSPSFSGVNVDPSELESGLAGISLPSSAARAALQPAGKYTYHPQIERVSGRLYLEGNFRQAVLDAFIHVIATVKGRTDLRNRNSVPYDGDDLMNRAFCPDNQQPPVRFNPLRTDPDINEQRGIWYLFKGVVGLRNFKAHIVAEFDDPERAHEYLALASLLMRLLDVAIYDKQTQISIKSPEHE